MNKRNRLAGESSPYLLQHAENPVEWYPWCEEAFKRAVDEDKPVFLSIGYSACHWCHVMAHESFENQDTADYLNDNFISIKVDREERPDIDNVYMEAVQAMTGRGGWPLSVFLTPAGLPYYGGTYFPPQTQGSLTGFFDLLMAMKHSYEKNRVDVDEITGELQSILLKKPQIAQNSDTINPGLMEMAFANIKTEIDPANGGLGSVPKFPEPLA
ncbi:MAG: thioredoxin domain-containing protein, partial [Chloroflexi bacterium]|nr:thioredoxin domain-containing protein [Chloroflexota bacterium]